MKVFKIFAAALVATMMFSCVNDKVDKPEGDSTIVLKVSTMFGSRANVDEVAAGYETPISNGYVFFTGGTEVYLAGAINSTEIISTEGQKFAVNSEATNIYVFGNTPAGFDGADFVGAGKLTDLLAEAFAISTQNASTTGNGLSNIFMYGTSTIDYSNKVTVGTLVDAIQVEIALTPSASRIEFEGIGLKTGSVITEYTVANVYLDYFYPQFTGAGTAAGTMLMSATASELTSRSGYDWAKDAIGSAVSSPSIGSADVTAGTDKVWAYQVAPGATPRIIIQVSGIKYQFPSEAEQTLDGDRFVTVSGWNDDTTTLIAAFVKGNVYHAENILFDFDDLKRNPNPGDIDLYVKVTSTPWVINLVTPVI